MEEKRRLEDFLSQKELGEVLGVNIDTIVKWRRQGLPSYRIGKRIWFDQYEVANFIKTRLRVEENDKDSD